jgi:hypothetical protein
MVEINPWPWSKPEGVLLYEENLSAEQRAAKKNPWLPRSDGNARWAEGVEKAKGQGT